MHSKLCLCLGLIVLLLVAPVFADWQPQPMGHPSITAAVTDSAGQRMLLGIKGAGIWQSEDGGSNWQPVSSRLMTGGRIEADKFDAVDRGADTLIAQIHKSNPIGNGFMRNLFSVNGGQSWQEFAHDSVRSTGRVYVSQPFHHVWFHISSGVLRRSMDYGQTWPIMVTIPNLDEANSSVEHFYQDPLHDSTLFYTGNYAYNPDDSTAIGGLVRSDDLGLTWRTVIDIHALYGMNNAGVENVLRLSNGNLAIISWSIPGVVLESSNEGETWSVMPGLPLDLFATRMVEDPFHAGRLFLVASCYGGLRRSDNYGQTWTDSLPGLPAQWTIADLFYQNRFSGQMILLAAGDVNLRSPDHGDSWAALPLPAMGAGCELSFTPQALFARTGGTEYFGTRHFAYNASQSSWQELPLPRSDRNTFRQITPILYKNADTLAAFITQISPDSTVSGVFRSNDNGQSWAIQTPLPLEQTGEPMSFGVVDTVPHLAVSSALLDTLYSSSDLGQTWNYPLALPMNEYLAEMVQNRQALYILTADYMGYGSSIYRSPNFGQSVDGITPVGHGFYHMVLQGDDLIVALGERALLHRRNVWTVQSAMPFARRTTNWEMISIPDSLHRLVAMIRDSSMLWISDDLGMTWQSRNMEMPFSEQNTRLSGLVSDTVNRRLWVNTGLGACYLNFNELIFSDIPLVLKPANPDLLTVYPNPFNNEARIRYSVERPGFVRMDLYNLTGQRVRTLVDRFQDAGRFELRLDAEGLASGTYFMRFRSPETVRTEKILVLK